MVRLLSYFAVNLGHLFQQLTYVGIVAAGAYMVTLGDLTVGALIACSILSGRALSALSQFPYIIVLGIQAKIALAGLEEMVKLPDDVMTNRLSTIPDSVDGSLIMDEVKFGYEESLSSLSIPTLKISAGERVAVLGPSGSGKTTFLRLLSGLYRPTTGRVFLDQHDMELLAPDYLRETIVYTPQDVKLFSGTLRDNLLMGIPSPTERDIADACEATGLAEVIMRHPMGLGLPITEGGLGLSAGQRQLVAVTRGLLSRPKVILLDEPSASMDRNLERRALGALFEGHDPDTTIVMVTHKISVIDFCSRVIVLDENKVVLDGPREQVLSRLSGSAGKDQR